MYEPNSDRAKAFNDAYWGQYPEGTKDAVHKAQADGIATYGGSVGGYMGARQLAIDKATAGYPNMLSEIWLWGQDPYYAYFFFWQRGLRWTNNVIQPVVAMVYPGTGPLYPWQQPYTEDIPPGSVILCDPDTTDPNAWFKPWPKPAQPSQPLPESDPVGAKISADRDWYFPRFPYDKPYKVGDVVNLAATAWHPAGEFVKVQRGLETFGGGSTWWEPKK